MATRGSSQRLAGVRASGQDLEQTGGQTGFLEDLGKNESAAHRGLQVRF
jgi:hypothetical protein